MVVSVSFFVPSRRVYADKIRSALAAPSYDFYSLSAGPVVAIPQGGSSAEDDRSLFSPPVTAMFNAYSKLFSLLDHRDRRRATLVLLLMLATAASEVVGVASIMPFIAVLADSSVVDSNKYLSAIFRASGISTKQDFLFALGISFFVLLVGSLILRGLSSWAQFRFSFNRTVSWSSRLIDIYLRQPYEWFLSKHSSDLATSILSEVDSVVTGALIPAMTVIAQTLIALLLLVLLLAVDPVLAISVAIVLGGGFATVAFAFKQRLSVISAARHQQNRARFHVVQEAFGGIKEIKISGLERIVLQRFVVPSNERAKHQIAAGMVESIPSLAMQAILFGGMLLVLLYLMRSQGTLQQALPIVSLYALAGYRLMPAVQRVSEESTKLRAAEAVIEALARDLHTLRQTALPPQPDLPSGINAPRLSLRSRLSLDSVSYQYPNAERPALDRVTLEIPAFHSVGIVGSTGSGKSTLVDVILGLLRPKDGDLAIDGVAIKADNLSAWQRSIGYVPQQIFLSDETIAANIAFGLPKGQVDMGAVERAARMANLHDFIVSELAQGYETPVGERGVRLSGGQRQRIGIARALYRDPEILVLDEATSALDNLTEQAVMEALHRLGTSKTVIMIAHRLSTVRLCNRIFLLERGKILAEGTYDELLEISEQFRRLALS